MRLGDVLRVGIPLATVPLVRPVSGWSQHQSKDSADFHGIRPGPPASIFLSASKKSKKSANYLTVASV
jgi:hypothetical protein